MTPRSIGAILMIAGAVMLLVGVLVASGAFAWFGRLPGDIRIERSSTRVYVPVTSMLVVSAGLSALVTILRRLL